MPFAAFGKFITSNPSSFPDSDQIAVGKYYVYIMQDASHLQYANKKTLALVGSVTISISISDENLPGMVWWDHKLYLPDNSGNLYYLQTNPTTGVPYTSLTRVASLPNFGSGTNTQFGFDFGRRYFIYKIVGATVMYYISLNDWSKTGTYATASGTNFAGSSYSSNFFVDGDGYMYLGIGDDASPDVRILRPRGTSIPITFELVSDVLSTTAGGSNRCDGLYPDPYDDTVVYTNNDDQTISLFQVVGSIKIKTSDNSLYVASCKESYMFHQAIVAIFLNLSFND